MSTTTNPTENTKTAVSAAITKAVSALLTVDAKLAVAFDNVRNTSKLETVKHGYTKQQLTSLLMDAGLDAPRTSEVCGFVFPAHSNSRKELDKAMEFNAKQDDNKKRIAKPVLLALQRDKTGELTLEAAQAAHKAKTNPNGLKNERTPGGQTNQTATTIPNGKKKSAKEIEDERVTALIAIFRACAIDEYSQDDCDSLVQRAYDEGEVFPETETETETETED